MAEPLKNQFFQRPFFEQLSTAISSVFPDWSTDQFFSTVYDEQWDTLELKGRMKHASFALGKCLPKKYEEAIDILKAISPQFSGFNGMLFSEFVMDHGLDHLSTSLEALELFTQSGSAEFAIRPFILKYEAETMDKMEEWSLHPNVHVRRLASEGCRPRLPWAAALPAFKKDPSQIIPILENLKNDPELSVRKSVANNLNDITKDNPDVALDLLGKWNETTTRHIEWITSHALRGMIKAGDSRALRLIGYEIAQVEIENFKLPNSVYMEEPFAFSFDLLNTINTPQNILVDYIIYHKKANGSNAPKVFKLSKQKLVAGETWQITKHHAFKSLTTRKYYPGQHWLSIQINGVEYQKKTFTLQ